MEGGGPHGGVRVRVWVVVILGVFLKALEEGGLVLGG